MACVTTSRMNICRCIWRSSILGTMLALALASTIQSARANCLAGAQRWKKRKRNQIQHIFTQLGHLNKLRNEILHYGAWMLAPGAPRRPQPVD
jgi:hypothetical protein